MLHHEFYPLIKKSYLVPDIGNTRSDDVLHTVF